MSVSHDHAADSTTVVTDYTAILAYLEGEHYRWNATDDLGVPVFVTYTFLSNDDLPTLEEYDPYDADGYYAYSSKQKANFRLALEEFEEHSGVVFVEVDDPDIAMIEAFGASGTEWAGWAYYPYVTTEDTYSSAIVIDYNDSFAPGLASYSTVIHEIGHALGLSHPHEGDILLDPSLDYRSNTIMSYEWGYPYEEVLGYLDVEALQHIYGEAPNMDGVTYRVNAENAFVVRGSDRADVFFGIDGENKIFGYDGDDYLIGREHNDEIYGGKGKDLITGGEGKDYLIG
ncbi:MAG: zinc-dependent metalloprotease family protein, partial [Hyphomicrobiales bacterium]